MESLKEIQEFLTLKTPQHLKSIATGYLLSEYNCVKELIESSDATKPLKFIRFNRIKRWSGATFPEY